MGIIIFLGDSITDAERKSSPNQLGYEIGRAHV